MLGTDSLEYEQLTRAVEMTSHLDPFAMTCEIGLRAGGGSKYIIDALENTAQFRTHIAIDPYGNIDYETSEGHITHHDYTNQMRDICIHEIFGYIQAQGFNTNFIFFNLEDTEFFNRYADGVPVYSQFKRKLDRYCVVHFDGPHAIAPLREEAEFFLPRTIVGGVWIFDDLENYNHDEFEAWLLPQGFELIERGVRKASYRRL